MKGVLPLFLGIFGTFAFSWVGLTLIPNSQIGHLDPQTDEEGSRCIIRCRNPGWPIAAGKIYVANGCVYCHSQQVRADYAASDIERKWGDRRSAPRDYIFERPVLLGKTRMGPDLRISASVRRMPTKLFPSGSPAPPAAPARRCFQPRRSCGSGWRSRGSVSSRCACSAAASPAASPAARAAPAAIPPAGTAASSATGGKIVGRRWQPASLLRSWHHRHLYTPRSVAADSNMPSFRFLYEKRRISGQSSRATRSISSVMIGTNQRQAGKLCRPYDARCLVAYLMSLDQSHQLKEVKSAAPAPAAAPRERQRNERALRTTRARRGWTTVKREDVQQVHAAIQREKSEPRVGLEPLSIWLIAVYGLAIFFGGAYLGRYSGNFSGDGLDPLGGAPRTAKSGASAGVTQAAELSPADRGKKIFSANCAVCHQPSGVGAQGQGYPPLAGSEIVNGGARRPAMIVHERIDRASDGQRRAIWFRSDAAMGKNVDRSKDCRRVDLCPSGMGKHWRAGYGGRN